MKPRWQKVKVTGATVHFVSEVVDGGAIIAQKAVEVEDGDTPETLQKRVMQNAEWDSSAAGSIRLLRRQTARGRRFIVHKTEQE